MKQEIALLLKKLQSGELLGEPLLDPEQIDAALDARDETEFDSNWIRIHELLKQEKLLEEDEATALRQIREMSFKMTYDSLSDPELSGCVADDFDLVSHALIHNLNDSWLNGLFKSYLEGQLPRGHIEGCNRKLIDQIRQ